MKSQVICDKKNRRLWILGGINSLSLKNKAVNFLNRLDAESSQPIKIIISSNGGEFFYCFEIYQTLRNLRSTVITIGLKNVDSGAFLIHQGGDERQAARSASFKFHRAIMSEDVIYKESRRVEFNKELLRYFFEDLERMDAIQIVAFTLRGRPLSKVISLFNINAMVTPYAAKKLVLVDKIILDRNVPRPPRKMRK